MRRAIALLGLLALFAVGCGGGDDQETETASGEPQTAIDPGEQERAESLVLEIGDLPSGWRASEAPEEGSGDECSDIDLSEVTKIGEADSQEFSMGQNDSISSSATVYATELEAQSVLERGTSVFLDQDQADCFKRSIVEGIEEEGNPEDVTVGDPELGELSFPVPTGVEEARAFQIMVPLEVEGDTIDGFYEIVVLRHADVVASLQTASVSEPLDPALRDILAQVIADRMAKSASPQQGLQ